MKRVTGIGGVFIKANDPAALGSGIVPTGNHLGGHKISTVERASMDKFPRRTRCWPAPIHSSRPSPD